MPVFTETSSSSANPANCEFGIELTREISTYPVTGRPQSHRMVITVTDWNNMTPNIFVYQRRGPNTDGDFRDTFEAVASPTDIEEYPVANPDAGEVPQLYRLSEIDLVDRNLERLDSVWDAIQEDVAELVRTCAQLCELEEGETIRFGDFPEDEVVEPPIDIPGSSSLPGPDPATCPVDEVDCLTVAASDDPDFPVGITLFSSTVETPPDCEREWYAVGEISAVVLKVTTSLVTNSFVLELDDGGGPEVYDSGNVADDYSMIVNYEKNPGEFHSLQLAIGADCDENLWTPAEISTVAWYDADDSGTITISTGVNISQWDDKSGNGYDLTQPSAGIQPEYNGQIGGRNVVYFRPNLDKIERTGIPDINVTNLTMFIVGQFEGGISCNMAEVRKTDQTDRFLIRRSGSSDAIRLFNRVDGSGSEPVINSATDLANGVPWLGTAYYDADRATLDINGGSLTVDNDSPDGATFTINELGMGRTSSDTQNQRVGELVILDTSDAGVRKRVEGYLAWKWGLEGKLPTGHPYKNIPPVI